MENTLPKFARQAHAGHVNRCLSGLPASQVELDTSRHAHFYPALYSLIRCIRLAIGFYCIGALELLELFQSKTSEGDRSSWREWIWEQQTRRYLVRSKRFLESYPLLEGSDGTGFRPSPFSTPKSQAPVIRFCAALNSNLTGDCFRNHTPTTTVLISS